MLEKFVDKLLEEVRSNVSLQEMQSNQLKYFMFQASLYSNAVTALNEKIKNHEFLSLEAEIFFFKNAKPKLLAEQHYAYNRAQIIQDCQHLSKDVSEEYFQREIQKIDAFFYDHKDFCTYLSLGDDHYDKYYFTRLSKRSNQNVDYYLADKDFRTTCEKGHIIGKIRSKKMLLTYLQSLLQKKHLNTSSDGLISINKLNWNGSQTDLVELIYALKTAGCINDTLLNISDALSQVFGSGNIDAYKIWHRIKSRKQNSTRLLSRLLESLIERIDEEKEL